MSEKKGPHKPFLDGDDLSNELDAWDATFDALHGLDETPPPAAPPMEWPEPTEVALAPAPPALVQDEAIQDEPMLDEPMLDEPAAFAPPLRLPTPTPEPTAVTAEPFPDPGETDFSDLGGEAPRALGQMLRSDTVLPVEDDVYTSASRPMSGDAAEPDEPVGLGPAVPTTVDPMPAGLVPPARQAPSIVKRTGPAIIRRQTPAMPMRAARIEESAFDEQTHVADSEQIAVHAERAARSKAPTAPPPLSFSPQLAREAPVDDDDYADIEVGGSSAPAAEARPPTEPPPIAMAPPGRRTATVHVVRRPEKAKLETKPHRESSPVIEIAVGDDAHEERSGGVVRAASEDDFSDVAAAVTGGSGPVRAPTAPPPDDTDDDDLAIPEDDFTHDVPIGELDDLPELEIARAAMPEPDGDDEAEQLAPPPVAYVRPPSLLDVLPTRIAPAPAELRVRRPSEAPQAQAAATESGRARRSSIVPVLARLPDVALPPQERTLAGVAAAPPRRLATPLPIFEGELPVDVEPAIDLEGLQLPEQVQPLPTSQLDEEFARSLEIYEREIETVDESRQSAALRIEAGRLCERLGETDRARSHYDAALLADPRALAALRGLRRIARAGSDLVEAVRQLDAELAVAGGLERRPLGHYRIDLLLASGEQDLARVAAGEILDSAPSDVRALLAQLELAFLDGRADEFGRALEQLAHAITDPELRAAVQTARGMLAAHAEAGGDAAAWFRAAAESDPGSLGARLGGIREAGVRGDRDASASALLELARQVEATDPTTAAALALRAQHWANGATEVAVAAAQLAQSRLPADPLAARAAAETLLAGPDAHTASAALAAWASTDASSAERAYAAARAAELEPARGAELWSAAIDRDPGDDYGAAQLRTAYVASDATQLAIEVDLAVAREPDRERSRLRAAFGLVAQGQLDAAIDLLHNGHAERPQSIALAEALAEALAAAGRWSDRAQLLDELAREPGARVDREIAQLRSALAWEEAVGSAAAAAPGDPVELQRTTAAALGAWDRMLEGTHVPAPGAHAAAMALAARLGDTDVVGEVLARAQAADPSPWAQTTLALRRARLAAAQGDVAAGEALLRDRAPAVDDPRRTGWLVLAAGRTGELGDAATALEERAGQRGPGSGEGGRAGGPGFSPRTGGDRREAGALRLRAAQLALDAGDAVRATALLGRVESDLPTLAIVSDLLAAARRRSGDRPTAIRATAAPVGASASTAPPFSGAGGRAQVPAADADAFGRIVRDGDLAAAQGDPAAAIALYQRALEIRPGDPLAALPLQRVAVQQKETGPITALALAQLRAAETAGDNGAKAVAYELLAYADQELRVDSGSAQIALESASQADPSRVDLMHRLEREYTAGDQLGELLRLRRAEAQQLAQEHGRDRAALLVDAAALAERESAPDADLVELYRAALASDPKHRVALLHLESIVRRAGASGELADLQKQIAQFFDGDPRAQAAFYTRAGETLAELGQIDAAVQAFGRADEVLPGHVAALEGWRAAALKGQLWIDVAQAATRQAKAAADVASQAALHHFAGVVLMDKALEGAQAMTAFRAALVADPSHKDAFLRLRILLEEDASHDELAIVLTGRLEFETEPRAVIELHRAIAELHRNFLDSRDIAKQHYRAILERDPNDLRAHAAVADIAWEQGNWQEAAEALMQRARLEHDRGVLTTLCYRLGLIYADRLNDPAMAIKVFQRALTYQPDDENTLARLADLATQVGEWKLALGACERLVKAEQDPDKRAGHLHRVARIFKQGFGDAKRAERALNLALDGAPTNDEALARLVEFYREAGDMTSVRVHLNRVAGTMRTRASGDPKDGVAYRVISRAMAARGAAGVAGSQPVARAAAELAVLLGAGGEPERALLAEPARVDLAPLLRSEADDVLFPRTASTELRELFKLLGDRLAKHVGVDLRAYGVGRGDRLRAKDSAVAAHAQDIATGLGFGEIDVYVSTRTPYAMAAEPTSPVSIVIGQSIAQAPGEGGAAIRFAAGSALTLARVSLAIPARLPDAELGVLVVALLRLFQPEFPQAGLDETAIATQAQKLRRLIPTGLMNELRPYGLAIDAPHFRHEWLARDLRIAGLRAGLVASGSLVAGLGVLAAAQGVAVADFLGDPIAQGLIAFALGEDYATLSR